MKGTFALADCSVRRKRQLGDFIKESATGSKSGRKMKTEKRREEDVTQSGSSTFAALHHFVCQYLRQKISAEINLTAVAVCLRVPLYVCANVQVAYLLKLMQYLACHGHPLCMWDNPSETHF